MKSYSLALGGGAAKGLCHIGVLKYIEENNIVIDEIAGTSMGAIIGACFAIGKPASEITYLAKNINIFKIADFSIKTGLLRGNRIYKEYEKIFGESLIEDTKIPLKIIATDINTQEKHIFKSGKIIDAIMASISAPQILPAFECNGTKYLDGGIKENLPILSLDGENIIAISAVRVSQQSHFKKRKNLFWNKWIWEEKNKARQKTMRMIMTTNEDLSRELAKEKGKKVLFLQPKTDDFSYHSFHKIDEIIKSGYHEAFLKLHDL